MTTGKRGLLALSPLMVFVGAYLALSLAAEDFYSVPISVAFLVASIYAVAICRTKSLNESIGIFTKGASTQSIIQMLWIFILAGAFASTAKSIGAVDATTSLILSALPAQMALPGLFLATCFISLSIGTSVGTIVALVPIAASMAQGLAVSEAMCTAIVVGGAFFGDNLSFISDTTIAATSSQGCQMKDKFKVNFYITLPAALIVLGIYTFMGTDFSSKLTHSTVDVMKVVPYLAVLATAIAGLNVMLVLVIGLGATVAIALIWGYADIFCLTRAMGDGITSMGELIIVTMLAGGMFETVRHMGGIDYLIEKISRHISGKRAAESVVALLVAAVDVCTANNTVAIISVGGIARRISEKFHVDPRKTASLLDTCSCCMQGIIPYGAQLLMATGLTHLSPLDIIPHLYYPMALAACVAVAIVIRYPRCYS